MGFNSAFKVLRRADQSNRGVLPIVCNLVPWTAGRPRPRFELLHLKKIKICR